MSREETQRQCWAPSPPQVGGSGPPPTLIMHLFILFYYVFSYVLFVLLFFVMDCIIILLSQKIKKKLFRAADKMRDAVRLKISYRSAFSYRLCKFAKCDCVYMHKPSIQRKKFSAGAKVVDTLPLYTCIDHLKHTC